MFVKVFCIFDRLLGYFEFSTSVAAWTQRNGDPLGTELLSFLQISLPSSFCTCVAENSCATQHRKLNTHKKILLSLAFHRKKMLGTVLMESSLCLNQF